jgi:hypothetical protein
VGGYGLDSPCAGLELASGFWKHCNEPSGSAKMQGIY